MDKKTCYTVSEAEKILGVSKKSIRHLIKKGFLETMIVGNKYIIMKKSLDEWLDGPDAGEHRECLREIEEGAWNMGEKRCYTVKELQDMLGVSRQAVYDLIKRGEFNSVIIAGRHFVSKRSFDAWLDGLDAGKREPEQLR